MVTTIEARAPDCRSAEAQAVSPRSDLKHFIELGVQR